MLDTLRNLDDHDALILLSSTVHSLLPDPGIGSRVTDILKAPAESRERLLHELRCKLRLNGDDESPRAKAEIFNSLSSEISKYALKNTDIRQVKARLGARGDLPPGFYEIDIGKDLRTDVALRGIRPNHLEEALHVPDAVQHLDKMRECLLSLFAKRVGSGNGECTLFVVALRDGSTLRVRDALRIYHTDVNVAREVEPLALLRAFLNRYGLPIRIGPRSGLLLINEAFTPDGALKDLRSLKLTVVNAGGELSVANAWHHSIDHYSHVSSPGVGGLMLAKYQATLSVVEIAIAYVFDAHRYREDLRRHGVPVPRD